MHIGNHEIFLKKDNEKLVVGDKTNPIVTTCKRRKIIK